MYLGLTVRRGDTILFGDKCTEAYTLCRNGRVLLRGLVLNIEVKNELKVLERLTKSVTVKSDYVISKEERPVQLPTRFEQKCQKFWLL